MTRYEAGRAATFERTSPGRSASGFEAEPDGDGTRLAHPVEMQPRGLIRVANT